MNSLVKLSAVFRCADDDEGFDTLEYDWKNWGSEYFGFSDFDELADFRSENIDDIHTALIELWITFLESMGLTAAEKLNIPALVQLFEENPYSLARFFSSALCATTPNRWEIAGQQLQDDLLSFQLIEEDSDWEKDFTDAIKNLDLNAFEIEAEKRLKFYK